MNREAFVSIALKYLGVAANYSGSQNNDNVLDGFDCSKFVNFVLKESGFPGDVPRYCNELFDSFGVLIHEQSRQAGDLVFFSYKGGVFPGHVGILVTKNHYIHMPSRSAINGRVVCVSLLKKFAIEPKEKNKQIYFYNPIGYKRITVKNGRYQNELLE